MLFFICKILDINTFHSTDFLTSNEFAMVTSGKKVTMYDNVIYKNHNFAKILERKENFVKYSIQIITETNPNSTFVYWDISSL